MRIALRLNAQLAAIDCPHSVPESTVVLIDARSGNPFRQRSVHNAQTTALTVLDAIDEWLDQYEAAERAADELEDAPHPPKGPTRGQRWKRIVQVLGALAAVATIAVAVPNLPPIRAILLLNEAEHLEDAGERELAEASGRQANATMPGTPYIQRRLGFIFFRNQKWAEGVAFVCRSLTGDPTHVAALTELGIAYDVHYQLDLAVPLFERALTKEPRSEYVQRNFAAAEVLAGDFRRAQVLAESAYASKKTGIAWGALVHSLAMQGDWARLQDLVGSTDVDEVLPAGAVADDDLKYWSRISEAGMELFSVVHDEEIDDWQDILSDTAAYAYAGGNYPLVSAIVQYFDEKGVDLPPLLSVAASASFKKSGDPRLRNAKPESVDERWLELVYTNPTRILGVTIRGHAIVDDDPLPSCEEIKTRDERFSVPTPAPT